MTKYRKKPVVVEAVLFEDTLESITTIAEMTRHTTTQIDYGHNPITLRIPTLEGVMTAQVGDYIIRGVEGEFYPCKPKIFEKTYEKVGE
ncbi:hypothetical protein [Bacillus safensis]|uniref:hypothetical protein n=1 Tax=Bacillus safensis TaxID=561879 RepID=UPI00040140ED|nr:hypothetical protein [Bacillus safensis]